MAADEIDTKGADALVKALISSSGLTARVGILGSDPRSDGKGSNASVGLRHEQGIGVVRRSFLEMPLTDVLPTKLESAIAPDIGDACVKAKSMRPLFERVAIIGKSTVLEAFATGGFGKWKPSIMDGKKVQQTLVETTQLRNSIDYDVVSSGGE